MNRKDLLERFGDSLRGVESKKEQTTKKIEYVSTYLREWARVMCGYNKVDALVFVDCMCNAGIYDDGDLGTISRVCALFCELPGTPINIFSCMRTIKMPIVSVLAT